MKIWAICRPGLAFGRPIFASPALKNLEEGKVEAQGLFNRLQSGGSGNAWDGTLHAYSNAVLSMAGSQSHSIAGGWIFDSGALFAAASSTVTFTATTTGKTIAPGSSPFYNIDFNGVGGNWAFSASSVDVDNVKVLFTEQCGECYKRISKSMFNKLLIKQTVRSLIRLFVNDVKPAEHNQKSGGFADGTAADESYFSQLFELAADVAPEQLAVPGQRLCPVAKGTHGRRRGDC